MGELYNVVDTGSTNISTLDIAKFVILPTKRIKDSRQWFSRKFCDFAIYHWLERKLGRI